MELAPAMLVPTVKSPHGARVVICGNHLTKVNEDENAKASDSKDPDLFSLYAGGADATALRCMMRFASLQNWTVGSVDVKTAFLLAKNQMKKNAC